MAAVASSPTEVSLERITHLSGEISRNLTERTVRLKAAMASGNALHKCGLELVCREFSNEPFHPQVDPVVLDIHNTVLTEDLQAYHALRGELAKTHRLFIEIMWYQKWRNKDRPTLEETIKKIKEVFGAIERTLPGAIYTAKDGSLFNPVATKYELACIGEAAKYLKPSEGEWKKYKAHAKTVAQTVAHVAPVIAAAAMALVFPPLLIGACAMPVGLKLLKSVVALVPEVAEALGEESELFEVLADAKEDRKATWYHDTWNFRWLGARVDAAQGFEKVIQTLINEFSDSGEKYAMCAVSALADMIEHNPGKEKAALRAKAFSGGEEYFGLLELANYEKVKKSDILPGVARGKRRRNVRELAIHHLARLAKNTDLPKSERSICVAAIQMRLADISLERKQIKEEEKDFIAQKVAELKEMKKQELTEIKAKLEKVEDKLGAYDEAGNPVRGETAEEPYDELMESWAELDQETYWATMFLNNLEEYRAEDPEEVAESLNAEDASFRAFMDSLSEEDETEYEPTILIDRNAGKREAS